MEIRPYQCDTPADAQTKTKIQPYQSDAVTEDESADDKQVEQSEINHAPPTSEPLPLPSHLHYLPTTSTTAHIIHVPKSPPPLATSVNQPKPQPLAQPIATPMTSEMLRAVQVHATSPLQAVPANQLTHLAVAPAHIPVPSQTPSAMDPYKNKVWRAGLSWIFRARMAWWSHLQARRRSLRAC